MARWETKADIRSFQILECLFTGGRLGRALRDGEVVHHENRCKTDYSDGNLHVFKSRKQHYRTHKKDGW